MKTFRGSVLKRVVPVKQLQKFNEGGTKYDGETEDHDSDGSREIKPPLKRRMLFPGSDGDSDMEDFMKNDNNQHVWKEKSDNVKKITTLKSETVTEENEKRETVNVETVKKETVRERNTDYSRGQATERRLTIKLETKMELNTDYSHGQASKVVERETLTRPTANAETVIATHSPIYSWPDSTSELSGDVNYEEVKPQVCLKYETLSTPKSRYKMGGNNNKSRLCLKKKLLKGSPEVEFTGAEEGGGKHFIPITDHTLKYVGVQFGIMDNG